ncbi:MAG: acyl-CoA dehydratase activase [Phycisphaerae bacterium]|nr:acyl-CoA dehydratase activase [Phycisphaerae bacterium]
MREQTRRIRETGQKRIFEAVNSGKKLLLGIDIGSTSSDIVVLDQDLHIIYSDYRRTMGRPAETIHSQLGELFDRIGAGRFILTAATGSAARLLAKSLDIPLVNEVAAQAAAVCHLYPHIRQGTIIEMGGQDSKLIFLSDNNSSRIRDFALNTVCAAGTGSFLDQQASRLGIAIEEEFGRWALESKTIPRMAGRCSVFAKSDMIHLQQQATPMCDIIAGLCLALARNLKSNLGCGRKFVKPIIFTGGVAANAGVVRAIRDVFEASDGELIVPQEHLFTGCIGAILTAKSQNRKSAPLDPARLEEYIKSRGGAISNAPRRERLNKPVLPPPASRVHSEILENVTTPVTAYLGIDVGSISTNVVVADENDRVLAKAYLMTAGRPLEAVREGLAMVAESAAGKVAIAGAATTGSGRYLTGDFVGADVVINEITAQAAGAAIVKPDVDTIFEIGGQDSKYISLENGVVVDFEMNHACAAGTGSFLEEQAQRLDINIKDEFAALAFDSDNPIKLGERCTVFMESDLLSFQQQGARTKDLVAGLSYSIAANYLNRVVGQRKIGNHICFQGGTAFNKAVWAAFESIVGKPVTVPDHHEVTGALGAASIVRRHTEKIAAETGQTIESGFKGFDNIAQVAYDVESFECEYCANNCDIKKVTLAESEPLYYGSRCDRYNLKKRNKRVRSEAFDFREKKMLEFAGIGEIEDSKKQKSRTVAIPQALITHQFLPLFAKFFKELGLQVTLSDKTTKRTIRKGVETVTAQPCFPVKVAYGHVAELLENEPDYIFIPSIVSSPDRFGNKYNKLCPYVTSFVYQAKTAFADRMGKTQILAPIIRLGESRQLLEKSFIGMAVKLGVSKQKSLAALQTALEAQAAFEKSLREKGKEILDNLSDKKRLFVLVSRPYNGCDEAMNLRLPEKLAELDAEVIPMDMLDLGQASLTDSSLHRSVYWSYGQKILRAAEIIKSDHRLFAIYLSNFSCGPDSFLMTFFRDIMADKPALQLELDEHSADAGLVTRLEAFLESLKNYRPVQKIRTAASLAAGYKYSDKRTLYIPYMSDVSYAVAAGFTAYGQPAEVMPMATEKTLLKGRRFTSGKECLPCAITAGDMLNIIEEKDAENVAFFMPSGTGPCRFGMYNAMHRLILKYAGYADVPVIAPNQDNSLYQEFAAQAGVSVRHFMADIWCWSVGIDLLCKLILRIRPIANDPKAAQRVYDESKQNWLDAIGQRKGLSEMKRLTESIAEDFARIPTRLTSKKPRIAVVGEIYVRSHPFANDNIIARLEELGAVCDLSTLAEWIYYTNLTRIDETKRSGELKNRVTETISDFVQRRIEKSLAEPLKRFGVCAEGSISHTIELARPYMDKSLEGEAVLSIGKMVEAHHSGAAGVVNVMPFGCMPSTFVSTQTMRISKDCGDMPILNLSFDGQEDAALTTRLEAFIEQVKSRTNVTHPAVVKT